MKNAKGSEVYDQLLEVHDNVSSQIQREIYGALGYVPTKDLKMKLLEYSLSDKVRGQDMYVLPMVVSDSGKEGVECAWAWLNQDYDRIYKRIGEGSFMLFSKMVGIC